MEVSCLTCFSRKLVSLVFTIFYACSFPEKLLWSTLFHIERLLFFNLCKVNTFHIFRHQFTSCPEVLGKWAWFPWGLHSTMSQMCSISGTNDCNLYLHILPERGSCSLVLLLAFERHLCSSAESSAPKVGLLLLRTQVSPLVMLAPSPRACLPHSPQRLNPGVGMG